MEKSDRETCDVDRTVCDARVAKAVAAELRRMAEYGEDGPGGRSPQVVIDNNEGTHGEDTHTTYANMLRERADQLDPPRSSEEPRDE